MLASGADQSLVSLVPACFSVCVSLFLGLWRRPKSRKPSLLCGKDAIPPHNRHKESVTLYVSHWQSELQEG